MRHRLDFAIAAAGLLLVIACGASKEVSKAREFIDAGMFDQAIILLKQEVQTNPKNAEAHMLLGAAYLGNGMTALAEQELNTATVLDDSIKKEASKRCYEVAKYLVKSNKAQAHTALMKAKEYDPSLDKDEQFFFLANIDTEDNESSRTDAAKRYLTLFPSGTNRAQATYVLAEGLVSSGDRNQAKIYFNQLASQFGSTEWGKKASDRIAHWTENIVIRVYNVDDLATVYLNGSLILTVPFKSSNQVDITSQVRPGSNEVRLVLQNSKEGYTYGFEILQNRAAIFKQECGQVDVVGCGGNEFRTGTVYEHIVTINAN